MASCFKENSVKIIRFKVDHMIIYNSSRNINDDKRNII